MNDGTLLEDVKRFYEILGKLERRLGGRRILAACTSSSGCTSLWRMARSELRVARA